VAIGAIAPQVLLVGIILLVADHAVVRRVFEGCLDMTAFTGCDGMQAYQRETRQVVFKTHLNPPAAWVVTAVTIFSLLPLVCVVKAMAAVTVEGHFPPLSWAGVTFVAGHLGVFVGQRKLGLCMVEFDLFPALGLMAVFTFVTITASMQIFCLMTGDAVELQILLI